jgi:hypothetical protein
MDTTPEEPDTSQAKPTQPEITTPVEPHSAPAVPAEVIRQLTKEFEASHHKKTAKSKPSAESAPELPKADTPKQVDASVEASPTAPEAEPHDDLDDGMSDPETDQAVDDIVSKESDELLAAEDAHTEVENTPSNGFGQKFKNFFYGWWHNKWARWITIIFVLAVIGVLAGLPAVRYKVLNAVGVRSSVSVVVLDNTTQLPLKNVTVKMAGQTASTNINGVAKIEHLKLGTQTLTVQRIAFATITQEVTLGWGSNPLGNVALKAVGTQYIINVTNYLSGKPLQNVEATSNGIEALSDKNGKVILTVDNQNAQTVPVAIILDGYRTEQLTLPPANTLTTGVQLVTDRKDVFISKQSGKYDLYKIDVDGKNKQVLLAGTGTENENISLVVSPSGDQAALVSTRDNTRDNDGYLLTTLTLINIRDGSTQTLDHAEQIQLIDWLDKRLIYTEAVAGASAANPQRYKLLSYDYAAASRIQLATANQFNGVLTANGLVYYTTAATDPSASPVFARIRPDSSGRQTVYNQEVWSIFRVDYNTVALQTPVGWFNYSIQNGQLVKSGAPTSFVSRIYNDSPDSQQSLWVDTRDGQGALISYNLANSKDAVVQAQDGLTYPVRWLKNDTAIYSVVTRGETADYVINTAGGKPHKITDVTHVYGITQGN